MLQGVRPEEVIRLVRARIANRHSRPECKLGLVVEAGAMRGVYSGGVLLALHLLNAVNVFDVAYGTSAGAINAAHFLSGAGHLKAATYYKALADSKFYNPLRFHRVVDVDYLMNDVFRQLIPMEMERIIASDTPLRIGVLNRTDAKGEVLELPHDLPGAWDLIRATVSMPLLYNKTVEIRGKQYADGGLPIPFPLEAAIFDKCTHLLILRTLDPDAPIDLNHPIFYYLYSHFFARYNRKLIEIYERAPEVLEHLGAIASGRIAAGRNISIATISPVKPKVTSSTMNAVILREACHQMAREGLALFGGDDTRLNALIEEGIV